ncbi:hypothetical protein AAZX31_11G041800 [Glycine max]|uniref:Uncharacterized protein n=2 Tax=Glycine subgen. Soja TaxID=1462606 RepID=C6TBD6_SOYBN|nr:uncharacterized protein LOC100799548 [Glycine max]XP_028187643.1 uncharacterized protein LOC114374223 [Glycine soja]ACU19138.1 unknown [Glycine max]KAG4973105.1 hypothetical protein JHK87_029926 [Glycine soja]KAG4987681.1 hypothetical protein JHK85_030664 [Glycine max]KAG4993302.1 hypothetical protein JHK86_030129 [Glycine max]KAG5123305.1 hypothetical protein JHK82_030042 [Glycine max]|eukprot:NP_001239964.1 uncharacterized protein LOC100799548 [Glycine max]
MGFFKRVAGFLGFGNHKHDSKDETDDGQPRVRETVVDRPHLAPVLTPSTSGDGGIQGLDWYVNHLRMDEDGDLADQFLDEVSSEKPEGVAVDHHKTQARFKLKNGTKSVRVKKPILLGGKIIPQIVESHQGRL